MYGRNRISDLDGRNAELDRIERTLYTVGHDYTTLAKKTER